MNRREALVVRWGAGIVVAALVCARVIPVAWRTIRAQHETLEGERVLLSRAEGAIADLDALERRTAAIRGALVALAPRLLSGGSEAEAVADLTGRESLAAGRARTRIVRTEQLADSAHAGRLRRVTVRLEIESDWSGLAGFFRNELADPAVLPIRAITLRGTETPSAVTGPEVVSGEVEVSGWYLIGGAPGLEVRRGE